MELSGDYMFFTSVKQGCMGNYVKKLSPKTKSASKMAEGKLPPAHFVELEEKELKRLRVKGYNLVFP